MAENFAVIVGEELSITLDCGVVFYHRAPTAQEIVKYKNSISFRKKGKSVTSQSAEQQLALADSLMIDVGRLGYKDAGGKLKALGKNTQPTDITHLKVDGSPPKSWKDLVPVLHKMTFIEMLLAGVEGTEKNL
jgi:hypothetical protein